MLGGLAWPCPGSSRAAAAVLCWAVYRALAAGLTSRSQARCQGQLQLAGQLSVLQRGASLGGCIPFSWLGHCKLCLYPYAKNDPCASHAMPQSMELAQRAYWCRKYAKANAVALRKILKKHDKLCNNSQGKQFLQVRRQNWQWGGGAGWVGSGALGCDMSCSGLDVGPWGVTWVAGGCGLGLPAGRSQERCFAVCSRSSSRWARACTMHRRLPQPPARAPAVLLTDPPLAVCLFMQECWRSDPKGGVGLFLHSPLLDELKAIQVRAPTWI